MTINRAIWGWPAGTLLWVFIGVSVVAQEQSAVTIELKPGNPTNKDAIAFTLSGVWNNGCVPQSPKVSIASGAIRIETSNPGTVCTQALTPWSLSGSLGVLGPGDYLLTVTYIAAGMPEPREIGRKAFTVTNASAGNEWILPIVVNGAIGPSANYQTIFTVLNPSSQEVHATVQVYNNSGETTGAFCSPLAPPPSSVTATLGPGAQLFRFTSADLPFLNGWARLRWDGSTGVLAGTELTLVAEPPQRCMLVCNWPSNEKLSSAQIPPVRPAREFRFPLTLNRYRQTALALVNPSAMDSLTATVTVLDGSGGNPNFGLPNSFNVSIGAQQRISKMVWDMVLQSAPTFAPVPFPEGFQGSVVITSGAPFAVGALNIMFPEGKFVTVPTISQ